MRLILLAVALLLAMSSRAGAASFDTPPPTTTTTATTTTTPAVVPHITLLAPKPGAVIVGPTVKVSVLVTGMTPARVTVNNNLMLRPGTNGTWSGTYRLAHDPGRETFRVDAVPQDGPGMGVRGWVRHYTGRTITPRPDLQTTIGILGCNPCVGQDKRGDALRNGPDITRVSAAARNGLVTVTITTANSWSTGTVCAFFQSPVQNPTARSKSGSLDCYGNKINNGGLDGDIPIAAPRHPNAHTTIIRFQVALLRRAPYLIQNPRFICIGVWSHGNADFRYDDFPNGTLGFGPMFKLQLRPDA